MRSASIEAIRQARQGVEALEATARSPTQSNTRNRTRNKQLEDTLAPFIYQFSANESVE